MGAITIDVEAASTVPAAKMFKGFFIDNILPKILPQVIKSVEIEGDGGVGTIKHVTFGEGNSLVRSVINIFAYFQKSIILHMSSEK